MPSPTTTPEVDQRARILEVALALMSDTGAHAMSMRKLATACGLNVATIYHYFPSKADLLGSVIAERRYAEQMAADAPPLDPADPPATRLEQLVHWLLIEGVAEQPTWKLLMGETLRGDAVARRAADDLLELLDTAVADWLAEHLDDLPGDPAATAVVVRSHLVACFFEDLVHDGAGRADRFARRARELAAALTGEVPRP